MVVKDKSDSETRPLSGWDVIVDLAQMWRDERNDRRQFAFDMAKTQGELVERSVKLVIPVMMTLLGDEGAVRMLQDDTVGQLVESFERMPDRTLEKVIALLEAEGEAKAAYALRLLVVDEAVLSEPPLE